jgi:hypothetical protein
MFETGSNNPCTFQGTIPIPCSLFIAISTQGQGKGNRGPPSKEVQANTKATKELRSHTKLSAPQQYTSHCSTMTTTAKYHRQLRLLSDHHDSAAAESRAHASTDMHGASCIYLSATATLTHKHTEEATL